MKVGIIGYGKMGKMVEKAAIEKGHGITIIKKDEKINDHADVYIDFTQPESVVKNLQRVASMKKPLVIGTTGWYDQLSEVKKIVEKYQIGCVYSPNFSIGVHLFMQLVEEAAKLFGPFDQYDVAGFEMHHNQKTDCPSGTAKQLAEILLKHIPRKKKVIGNIDDRKIEADELHFPAVRVGNIPGTHQITFDSPADTITLTHTARNREGFARGAITAAELILDKKGLFHLQELLT